MLSSTRTISNKRGCFEMIILGFKCELCKKDSKKELTPLEFTDAIARNVCYDCLKQENKEEKITKNK